MFDGEKLKAGIDFLEFRPSEIAAAAAIFVSGEIPTIDIDNPDKSYFLHLEKVLESKLVGNQGLKNSVAKDKFRSENLFWLF